LEENTNAQDNTQTETPSWFYQSPTDDNKGVGGNGEVPDWLKVDKYKSVEDQAKAYPELASRFGGFESSPDEYSMPEGYEDGSLDEGMLDILKAAGKEHQMGQGMFNDLVTKLNEQQTTQMEQGKKDAMEALGENAEARIQNVNDWLNVNAPKEIVEMVVPMGHTAEAIQALEFFIDKSKGSKVADSNAQPANKLSQTEYADMLMAKDNHGNLRISVDPAYKKQMDEMTLQMQG